MRKEREAMKQTDFIRHTKLDRKAVYSIKNELKRLRRYPVLILHQSNELIKEKWYLVLAEKRRNGKPNIYTVWLFNSETGNFYDGHYRLRLSEALQELGSLVEETNINEGVTE